MAGEADKGAGNGKTGGEGEQQQQGEQQGSSVSKEEFKELTNVVSQLANHSQQTQESLNSLMETLKETGGGKGSVDDDAQHHQQQQRSQVSDQELESMDRKQFMSHIVNTIGGVIDQKVGKIDQQIKQQSQASAQQSLQQELKEVRSQYKDFDEWKPELRDLAKKNPHASFEDMYLLARTKNPEKAKELDKKYNLGESQEDGDKQGGNKSKGGKNPGYGGAKPSSGSEMEESHSMSKKDAAEKAYEDTMKALDFVDHNPSSNPV